jgi:methyltransferase family protein
MRTAKIKAVSRACRHVDGWFSPAAAQFFGLIDEIQRQSGVSGDLFEIGVHHGRSAVLLCHMAQSTEAVGLCDLFGAQEDNVSESGHGDRPILERNLAALAPPGSRVKVFEKRSDELTIEEIGSPYRFFHIDGGHLLEEALGDLQLGAAVLHERGVLVIDDPFRAEWPGVTEAVIRLLEQRSDLVPIALGFNKLVIARRDARGIYDQALAEPWAYIDRRVWATKVLPFAGSQLRIFLIPSYRRMDGLDRSVARGRWLQSALRTRLEALASWKRLWTRGR